MPEPALASTPEMFACLKGTTVHLWSSMQAADCLAWTDEYILTTGSHVQ